MRLLAPLLALATLAATPCAIATAGPARSVLAAKIALAGEGDDTSERTGPPRYLSTALVPNDPLWTTQWALGPAGSNAFPLTLPAAPLATVRVAVVDGGIDPLSPDLEGRVVVRKSFVPDRRLRESLHGTMVAGVVAATTDNAAGFASIGLNVELMDLQVVRPNATIEPADEAAAIRYAVDNGARVINLSLGALRNPGRSDPAHPDGYDAGEAAAVAYAVSKGVVVVAAAGNESWIYADWPGALPHVIGVGALQSDSTIPRFSNRDSHRIDLVAPGVGVTSTVPTSYAASGLSTEAPFADGLLDGSGGVSGTSFAAPQVAATAALLLGIRPDLDPSRIRSIINGSARDVPPAGRDRSSGFGALDVNGALTALAYEPLPPRDRREPNDGGGTQANTLRFRSPFTLQATASSFDDQLDAYRVSLEEGQVIELRLRGLRANDFDLLVVPGNASNLSRLGATLLRQTLTGSSNPFSAESLSFRAPAKGAYCVVVLALRGEGPYRLTLRRLPV